MTTEKINHVKGCIFQYIIFSDYSHLYRGCYKMNPSSFMNIYRKVSQATPAACSEACSTEIVAIQVKYLV